MVILYQIKKQQIPLQNIYSIHLFYTHLPISTALWGCKILETSFILLVPEFTLFL